MKTYTMSRGPLGCVASIDGERRLDARHDLRNHSPDGFSWGYMGSGPAQLALALLADATGSDTLAEEQHQHFKRAVVGVRHADVWTITDEWIKGWLHGRLDGDEQP